MARTELLSDRRPAPRAGELGAGVYTHLGKRSLDIGVASVLVLLLLPLAALIALAIAADSRGPVLFRQERVGARARRSGRALSWERRTFRVLKFRSMRADAGTAAHEAHVAAYVNGALERADGRAGFKLTADPRVTRVGRLLRRTSLDELPQLLNVLRGEMSLVGPRPLPPYEVRYFEGHHDARFTALPGLTGLWQVSGRADVSFQTMIELDLEYVRSRSLRVDLRILVKTIPAILRGRGAA